MNRRGWLLGGAGAAAAAAGATWALRQQAPSRADGLWALRFAQPGGGELLMSSFQGRPLVLNFWATWCAPCVRELPAIDRFHRQFASKGWQVVGLAVDNVEPVQTFLTRLPLGFAIGVAGVAGLALSRDLGNEVGALPFTALIDAAGVIRHRKLGETSLEELTRWANVT